MIGIGKRLASASGRGMVNLSSSKAGMAAVGLGAAGLGLANSVAPAARDAALDVGLGDPNADVAFTGRKISSRYLFGDAMGGFAGGALKMTAPDDAYAFDARFSGPANIDGSYAAGAGVGTLGAAVGGGIGYLFGKKKGAVIGAGVGAFLGGTAGMGSMRSAAATTVGGTTAGAVAGGAVGATLAGIRGMKRGKALGVVSGLAGGIAGIGVGGAVGGTAGAAVGAGMIAGSVAPPLAATGGYVRQNQRFFDESPYNGRKSATTASVLNASGDIVLGMHNSRRGY